MTDRSLLCESADAVTAQWMRQALAGSTAFASARVEAVAVERLGSTANALGSLLRCHLTVRGGSSDAPAVPETVIVKLPGTDRKALKFARWLALHQREYEYYRHAAAHVPMRSPALHYGEFDPRSHRFVLVLEDLREMETFPETIGVEAGRAGLAVREAARLHGRFWNTTGHSPLSGLHDSLSPKFARILQLAYVLSLPAVLERFEGHFSRRVRRLAEALGPRLCDHFAAVAAGPRTLIHGDYRGANLFFGPGDAFAAIDWQGTGSGCGLYDIAYFMAISVPTDDRRRMERGALAEYHDIVCRMGAKNYAFEDCWRSYRKNLLGALMALVLGCGGLDVTDRERRNLASTMLSRTIAAVEDLEADEFLPERSRFMGRGHGFSTLSRWIYRAGRAARRLRARKARAKKAR